VSTAGAASLAVLIDLDGTLVDTVDLWRAAYERLAEELGVSAPEDLWSRVAGRSMHASLEALGPVVGQHDPDELVARLVAHATAGLLAEGAEGADVSAHRWLPGARELLETLRPAEGPRPRVALVTSAWRGFTVPLLRSLLEDPAGRFDAVVCGDDVGAGKPDPESHLRAVALLGADVQDCLVIEDSRTGVEAAEAAGMVTLVVPHAGPVDPAPGRAILPDLVGLTLDRLVDLHARLRSDVPV
jgi:HAD superfamily hydrolase (TIGR01509 family)